MKKNPNDENEIFDLQTFVDPAQNVVTPVLRLEPSVALALASTFSALVHRAHRSSAATAPNNEGVTRAQNFEEGDVYMLEAPFEGFPSSRYVMDFYDVGEKGICSRMHLHTGLRFVRMLTGPDSTIRVGGLSPFVVTQLDGVTDFSLEQFEDLLPDGLGRIRYNLIVPPCSMVDMQIPRGVSHQFNASGPYAIIDSVHPEESIEIFREHISSPKMLAQTVFLTKDHPDINTCSSIGV